MHNHVTKFTSVSYEVKRIQNSGIVVTFSSFSFLKRRTYEHNRTLLKKERNFLSLKSKQLLKSCSSLLDVLSFFSFFKQQAYENNRTLLKKERNFSSLKSKLKVVKIVFSDKVYKLIQSNQDLNKYFECFRTLYFLLCVLDDIRYDVTIFKNVLFLNLSFLNYTFSGLSLSLYVL